MRRLFETDTSTVHSHKRSDGETVPLEELVREFGEVTQSDRYDILEQIGAGGMGEIYLAADTVFKRKVALKKLPKDARVNEKAKRFIQEAKITSILQHPNIVPIYDLVYKEEELYYAMKLIEGESFSDVLKKIAEGDELVISRHSLAELLSIYIGICDAIAYAHDQGVIHRDLKPSNVMIGSFGEVMVLDWGIAKFIDHERNEVSDSVAPIDYESYDRALTFTGEMVGSLHFMSPEQIKGDESLSRRSDIFSLGAILYQILTLQKPFRGRDMNDTLSKNLNAVIDEDLKRDATESKLHHLPKGRLPSALVSITKKAMAIDPVNRYQQVADLRDDVVSFMNGYSTSAEEVGWLGRLGLLIKRRKRESLIVSLLGVLAFTGAYLFDLYKGYQHEKQIREDLTRKNAADAKRKWHLVFREDFEEEMNIFDKWAIRSYEHMDGSLKTLEGTLEVGFRNQGIALLRPSFAGDVKVKFDVWLPKYTLLNTIAFLVGSDMHYKGGYHIHIGDMFNKYHSISIDKKQVHVNYDDVERVKVEHWHQVVMIKEGGSIQVELDGHRVIDYKQNQASASHKDVYIGFSALFGTARYDNIEIYQLSLPRKVNSLEMALDLKRNRQFDLAERYLSSMTESLSNEADRLRAMIGLCEIYEMRKAHKKINDKVTKYLSMSGVDLKSLKDLHKLKTEKAKSKYFYCLILARMLIQGLPGQDNSRYLKVILETLPESMDIGKFMRSHIDKPVMIENFQLNGFHGDASFLQRFKPRELGLEKSRLDSWDFMENLPLESLSISSTNIRHLDQLAGMKLRRLGMKNTEVNDIRVLKNMPLFLVDMRNTKVSDLTPLENSPIQSLYLGGNAITDISPLIRLPLKSLYMQNVEGLDLGPLSKFSVLRNVIFYKCRIEDLRSLKGLSLRSINLTSTRIDSLQGLEWMKSLQSLFFNATDIKSLEALRDLDLRRITMARTHVEDLSPLAGQPITDLQIDKTQVTDIEPLRGMPLSRLRMNDTRVKDISVLETLHDLEHLVMSHTSVKDFSPLKSLRLKSLLVMRTAFSDLSQIPSKSLLLLEIGGTQVRDLNPLIGSSIYYLGIQNTPVDDIRPLSYLPLIYLRLDVEKHRKQMLLLKGIPTLTHINDIPIADFWGKFDKKK